MIKIRAIYYRTGIEDIQKDYKSGDAIQIIVDVDENIYTWEQLEAFAKDSTPAGYTFVKIENVDENPIYANEEDTSSEKNI